VAAGGGFVTVTDPAAAFSAGTGCAMVTANQARCPSSGIFSMVVRGLDGDDQLTGRGGGTVDGGAGHDQCASDLRGLLEQQDGFVGCEVTQVVT
jgi:hypothetical protein